MNKYLIGLTILIIFLVGAYYLLFTNPEQQVSPTPTSTPESIKVGMMVPLSGDQAQLGEPILAAAQLAVKEINDGGGVNGRPLEIVFEDDQCSKDGGVTAATKLVTNDRANVVLGSPCVEADSSVNTVMQAAGVPTVIIGSSAPDLTKAGDFIFRIYPSETLQGKLAAELLYQNIPNHKAVVVFEKNDWGKNLGEAFINRFKELGGKVVYEGNISSDKEVKSVASKIKSVKSDVVFLPISATLGLALLKQLNVVKSHLNIVGTNLWAVDSLVQSKDAEGAFYLDFKRNNYDNFKNKLKDSSGKDANVYSAFAYDAVNLLAEVMKQVGTDKKTVHNSLLTASLDKVITSSVIEFDTNRELKNIDLELKKIEKKPS